MCKHTPLPPFLLKQSQSSWHSHPRAFLINPALTPGLLPALSAPAARGILVAPGGAARGWEVPGSPLEVAHVCSRGLEGFCFVVSCCCVSHIITETRLSQDFLPSIFLVSRGRLPSVSAVCTKYLQVGLCPELLASAASGSPSFLSSHPRRFLTKREGSAVGQKVPGSSPGAAAPLTAVSEGESAVVVQWFPLSLCSCFGARWGPCTAWLSAALADKKQKEVTGGWLAISAPRAKISRISRRFIIHASKYERGISNTICTGFQGCFAQVAHT